MTVSNKIFIAHKAKSLVSRLRKKQYKVLVAKQSLPPPSSIIITKAKQVLIDTKAKNEINDKSYKTLQKSLAKRLAQKEAEIGYKISTENYIPFYTPQLPKKNKSIMEDIGQIFECTYSIPKFTPPHDYL